MDVEDESAESLAALEAVQLADLEEGDCGENGETGGLGDRLLLHPFAQPTLLALFLVFHGTALPFELERALLSRLHCHCGLYDWSSGFQSHCDD